jgi:hypothetical protein
VALCKECGASIIWVRTAAHDRNMPLNPVPEDTGKVAVRRERGQLVKARVITDAAPLEPGETAYLAHYATCTKNTRRKPAATKPTRPEPPALF